MTTAKVLGLEQLRAKLLGRYGRQIKAAIRPANEKDADEFLAKVRSIIPEDQGELADTLEKSEVGATGFRVTEGDAAHPYPAHLEWGHRAADGSHVPAKPHWFTALRVLRKRRKARAARAMSQAAKSITAG